MLFRSHGLEVGERNLRLVRELASREAGDALFATAPDATACDVVLCIDDQFQFAALINTALQQGRGKDQVLHDGDLTLQFLRQIDTDTSAFNLDDSHSIINGASKPLSCLALFSASSISTVRSTVICI